MERRLKERLTGAAILVALIVLVVPELFRGSPGSSRKSGVSRAAGSAPSYTIDLSGKPPSGAQPPQGSSAPTADPTAAAVRAPASTRSVTPASMGSATPASAAAEGSGPRRASIAEPPAAAGPAPGRTSLSHWHVQLGLFRVRADAQRLVRRARAAGFRALVSAPDAYGRYRVLLAGIQNPSQVRRLERSLRARGMAAIAVRAP